MHGDCQRHDNCNVTIVIMTSVNFSLLATNVGLVLTSHQMKIAVLRRTMNTTNQIELLDFVEEPVASVEAKLAILAFSYKWAEMVEREEKLQTEILDFGEDPVTSVEDKLAILAFSYNWGEMVEKEEKLKGNGDIPGPQEHLKQTNVMSTVAAASSSTAVFANSKILAFPSVEKSKDLCNSHQLQLGKNDNQPTAEANSNECAENSDEAFRMDNSVIQDMKRPVHIFDAKTGVVAGEIHAQYRESDERDRQPRRTEHGATVSKELQNSYPQTTLLDGTPVRCSTNSGTTVTCSTNSGTTVTCSTNSGTRVTCSTNSGTTATCSTKSDTTVTCSTNSGTTVTCSTKSDTAATSSSDNRTRKIRGLEIIDQEISILSTVMNTSDIQESKNQETDAENEYFTKHPLMRLFLCGACCSKKGKPKTIEKVGLFRRIRKIFQRN